MLSFSRTWMALVAVMFLAIPARAEEVDKYLPDDTEIVFVVNVKQILASPIIQKHAMEKVRALVDSSGDVKKVLDALGLDPLKDIDSLTAANASLTDNDKGLGIIHGHFDLMKFQAKAAELARDKADLLKIHKVEGGTRLLTIVLVRDTIGKRPDQMFYCTNLDWSVRQILSTYSHRWAIECTFENCKQFLGLEDPANRVRRSALTCPRKSSTPFASTASKRSWSMSRFSEWFLISVKARSRCSALHSSV